MGKHPFPYPSIKAAEADKFAKCGCDPNEAEAYHLRLVNMGWYQIQSHKAQYLKKSLIYDKVKADKELWKSINSSVEKELKATR